jgi:hypothetical protein
MNGFNCINALCSKMAPACLFLAVLMPASGLLGQDGGKPAKPVQEVKLSAQQLKALEGYFRNPGNPDMVVQFTGTPAGLLAKMLWNNRELHLMAESPLAFVSREAGDEGPFRLKFLADSGGTVNKLDLGRGGTWTRLRDYKPVVHSEMAHTAEQLREYEGVYQAEEGDRNFIQFLVRDNKLILRQHWDGNEVTFVPETPTDFFSKEVPMFTLSFTRGSDGLVSKALAFRRDWWDKLKPYHPDQARLKTLEGKFQSKDDPDNLIELLATPSGLKVRQLWDGKETPVSALADSYFYNSQLNFPLILLRDKEGLVTGAVILGTMEFRKILN